MKYAYMLGFAALALAQEESCVSVVTATEYETFTVCPCSSTTLTLSSFSTSPSLSLPSGSSSSTDGGAVDPTLTGLPTTTSVPFPTDGSNSTDTASFTTLPTDTFPPPPVISSSSAGTETGSVGDPTLTSASDVPPPATTTPTTPTSQAPPPVAPQQTQTISLATLGDYQSRTLLAHNLHRDNSSIPRLVWDPLRAEYARELAATCSYGHSNAQGDGNYGQNIGAGFSPDEVPVMITNSMYNGEINFFPQYNVNNIDLSNFAAWGHFSQLIWSDTVSVGCFTQDCSATGLANSGSNVRPFFTVCNYFPPGNFDGQWAKVAQPQGGGSVVFVP